MWCGVASVLDSPSFSAHVIFDHYFSVNNAFAYIPQQKTMADACLSTTCTEENAQKIKVKNQHSHNTLSNHNTEQWRNPFSSNPIRNTYIHTVIIMLPDITCMQTSKYPPAIY